MADEDSDIDLGEGSDVAATPAKKGIGGLLPTILKYVGLGVGAVILIVTVSLITVKIVTKNSTKTQQVPISEDFKEYAEQIIKNAQMLADELVANGLDIVGGKTERV